VLLNQIKAGAYERSLKEGKVHNFPAALPEHLAEQAEEALKSSYNRFLKALVAIELKVGPFEPAHAGQMDFYLNLLNDKERGSDDGPSIGIILCAEKDNLEVEFALRTKTNPIGVAEYQLQPKLPVRFRGKLPVRSIRSNGRRPCGPPSPAKRRPDAMSASGEHRIIQARFHRGRNSTKLAAPETYVNDPDQPQHSHR